MVIISYLLRSRGTFHTNTTNVFKYMHSSPLYHSPSYSLSYDVAVKETLELLFDAYDTKIIGESGYKHDSELDATLSNDVLTLKCTSGNTIVINKQPPNSQLWFSSPLSGPRRFDWKPLKMRENPIYNPVFGWICHKDSKTRLITLLEADLSQLLCNPVHLFDESFYQQANSTTL